MIHVEPIFCDDVPRRLEDDWRELLDTSGPAAFEFEFEIISAWARHLRGPWRILLLAVHDEDKIIGIFPLMTLDQRRRGLIPYRRIRFLAHGHSNYSRILSSPANIGRVVDAALSWLTSNAFRWELMILDDLHEADPAVKAISAASTKAGVVPEVREGKYYYIHLRQPWEEIWAATSKKYVRRNVLQGTNRLTKEGTWRFIHEPDWDAETIISQATPIHEARQSMLERNSLFRDPAWVSFLQTCLTHHLAAKRLKSHWLELNGKLIAYIIGFVDRGTYYLWNLAFLPEFAKFNPSSVLLAEVVKTARQTELQTFSFMRGETEYKSKWTSHYDKNFCFTIRRADHLYGKLVQFIERLPFRIRTKA